MARAVRDTDGPFAALDEPITGSRRPFLGTAIGWRVPTGWVEHERVAAGEATDHEALGRLGPDGRWRFRPLHRAAYRTRVLIRRPAAPEACSGTVIVEWLNVSGGLDGAPGWMNLEEEIVRRGHVWVGLSAQHIGVEGGEALVHAPSGRLEGRGLRALDPERYASLHHPGDGFSFDVLTQVARAVRAGGPVLGGLVPDVVLAYGESQSAAALVTYANGVHPLAGVVDGVFVHSRPGNALPLAEPGRAAAMGEESRRAVLVRDDLDVPVMELQAEGDLLDLLGSVHARQPDTEGFRLWEVAGTAHADRHMLGPVADHLDCGAPINDGPMHLVAKAALRGLETWVRSGPAPSTAPRLDLVEGPPPAIARDPDGIATGGVRTPPVDVPIEVLSGDPPPRGGDICRLLGSTTPLPPERLAARYPSGDAYLERFAAAADAAIAAGFVLAEDRDALLGYARPERLG